MPGIDDIDKIPQVYAEIFKFISFYWIQISLMVVWTCLNCPINKATALVKVIAKLWTGDRPLPKALMT